MIDRLWRYLFIQTLIGLIGAAVIITAVNTLGGTVTGAFTTVNTRMGGGGGGQ